MEEIFISYRRAGDNKATPGRIYEHLQKRYGHDTVFLDVYSIEAGKDFRTEIINAASSCKAFLAVIDPNWLTHVDKHGKQRLANEDDFVRLEISIALKRKIEVFPVLILDAEMPAAEALPDPLKELASRNAIDIRPDPALPSDMRRLCKELDRIVDPYRMLRWVPYPLLAVISIGIVLLWCSIPNYMNPPISFAKFAQKVYKLKDDSPERLRQHMKEKEGKRVRWPCKIKTISDGECDIVPYNGTESTHVRAIATTFIDSNQLEQVPTNSTKWIDGELWILDEPSIDPKICRFMIALKNCRFVNGP